MFLYLELRLDGCSLQEAKRKIQAEGEIRAADTEAQVLSKCAEEEEEREQQILQNQGIRDGMESRRKYEVKYNENNLNSSGGNKIDPTCNLDQSSGVSSDVAKLLEIMQMPEVNIPKFDGEPLKY